MNKTFFYPKLAISNLRKNSKTYFPFLLSGIGTVMMFYMLCFISTSPEVGQIYGGEYISSLLFFGTIVIGIFSLIFLFYTNSFLIKRRKKELSLYNILGMEKRHIAKMLFYETFFLSFSCIILGLILGILLSKLMFLLLLNLINFKVPFTHFVSISSIIATIILFAGIFLLTLLTNLRQIHHAKPIELLQAGRSGEREPKTKWLLTLFGLVFLGSGYAIALLIQSPLLAIPFFFVAVVLVILGTYCLFTAGSIFILKILRKNKKFYYQTKHFTTLSGMIYRMKQNAAGLANICILSTAVLVLISTTISMYIGMEDILETRFPKRIKIERVNIEDKEKEELISLITNEAKNSNISLDSLVSLNYYTYYASINQNQFSTEVFDDTPELDNGVLNFISLEDYKNAYGEVVLPEENGVPVQLEENEVLLYSNLEPFSEKSITLNGEVFQVKGWFENKNLFLIDNLSLTSEYCIVMKDKKTLLSFAGENERWYLGFNPKISEEEEILFTHRIKEIMIAQSLKQENQSNTGAYSISSRADSKSDFYFLYGGLFFLGIFLGFLFLMATVLIIYYKQVSEGFDDKERFQIMQKVGMSKKEVKKSIHSQVLMVFFLPLLTAVIHIAFAFPLITKLLLLLNLSNTVLFLLCTGATIFFFALVYILVYFLTAKAYYKIVN